MRYYINVVTSDLRKIDVPIRVQFQGQDGTHGKNVMIEESLLNMYKQVDDVGIIDISRRLAICHFMQ